MQFDIQNLKDVNCLLIETNGKITREQYTLLQDLLYQSSDFDLDSAQIFDLSHSSIEPFNLMDILAIAQREQRNRSLSKERRLAFVVTGHQSKELMESIISHSRGVNQNMKVFYDRRSAYRWVLAANKIQKQNLFYNLIASSLKAANNASSRILNSF